MGRSWTRAPLVLRHYPLLAAGIVAAAAVAALAGTSTTFIRAAVESQSLRGVARTMSPERVGLEVETGGPIAAEPRRRAAAARLAETFPSTNKPVLATMASAQTPTIEGTPLTVVAMARTDVVTHVTVLAADHSPGVWISKATSKVTGLRVGSTIKLEAQDPTAAAGGRSFVRLHVHGIYKDLEERFSDPYWVNFVRDIAPSDAQGEQPPPFVLMPERLLERVARRVSPLVVDRFEFPVDPNVVTRTRARKIQRAFVDAQQSLATRHTPLATAFGCGFAGCPASSSLDSALGVAATDVAEIGPTLSLLSGIGVALSLAIAVAAGMFLVRRRRDEAELSFARGEARGRFALRVAVESFVPVALGAAAGFLGALATSSATAPPGTAGRDVLVAGVWRSIVAGLVALVVVAVGAAAALPRQPRPGIPRRLALRKLPWELAALAVAIVCLVLVLLQGEVVSDSQGIAHTNVALLLLPVFLILVATGSAVRLVRPPLRTRLTRGPVPLLLAARRLASSRAALVAVIALTAAAAGSYVYATVLRSSLARGIAEKSYVSNGSDVQGIVDPSLDHLPKLPFPAAVALVDWRDVTIRDGRSVDVVAGDPAALARAIRWGTGWSDDPRQALQLLARSPSEGALDVIASPATPAITEISNQGKRIPVRVVARARFPGTSSETALLVSRADLTRFSRRAGLRDPLPYAQGIVWAKGSAAQVEPALYASPIDAVDFTALDRVDRDPAVVAANRSFGYLRIIGVSGSGLAIVALLLYLQARRRSQVVASGLMRRMGLTVAGDAVAVAAETIGITLGAAAIGAAFALLTAAVAVDGIDPLPQYSPATFLVVPWVDVVAGVLLLPLASALVASAMVLRNRSAQVVEALRVG